MAKGKDPAFLFYSNDFLTGVADLTMEERGQYITLLCLQHQKGALTEKAIKISTPNVSEDVLVKFSKDEKGNYFNERLEIEREKRLKHSEKQRQRALDGWKKRRESESSGDTTADAAALPLENEDEIENKDLNRSKGERSKKPRLKMEDVICPWQDSKFTDIWEIWVDYRIEKRYGAYKPIQLQAAYKKLAKISGGQVDVAIEIINESISNGWQGLFALKNGTNGKGTSKNITDDDIIAAVERRRQRNQQ